MTDEQELRESFAEYLPTAQRGLIFHFDPSSVGERPRLRGLRRFGLWGVAVAGLAIVAVLAPIALHRSSPAAPHGPTRFVLPMKQLGDLDMVSMTRGWALPMSGHTLYYTDDGGLHWTQFKGQFGSIDASWPGSTVWSFAAVRFGQVAVKTVTNTGAVRQNTLVYRPTALTHIAWTISPNGQVGGLLIAYKNPQGLITDEVATFGPGDQAAHILYHPHSTHALPILSGLTVASPTHAWVVANTPGPGQPAFWQVIPSHHGSEPLSPIALPVPASVKSQGHPQMSPAPIAGPQLFPHQNTGFLATTYQTVAARSGRSVSAAILYREQGNQWIPIWYKTGHMVSATFVSASVGWVEYQPSNGAVELLQTTDGGTTFTPVRIPGPGQPDFVNTQDGWWTQYPNPQQVGNQVVYTPTKLWATQDGGRTWTRVKTVIQPSSSRSS
jgi:hypothetical protein